MLCCCYWVQKMLNLVFFFRTFHREHSWRRFYNLFNKALKQHKDRAVSQFLCFPCQKKCIQKYGFCTLMLKKAVLSNYCTKATKFCSKHNLLYDSSMFGTFFSSFCWFLFFSSTPMHWQSKWCSSSSCSDGFVAKIPCILHFFQNCTISCIYCLHSALFFT